MSEISGEFAQALRAYIADTIRNAWRWWDPDAFPDMDVFLADAIIADLGLEQVGWRTFTDDSEDDWWWMGLDEQLPVNHRSEPFYRLRAADIGSSGGES